MPERPEKTPGVPFQTLLMPSVYCPLRKVSVPLVASAHPFFCCYAAAAGRRVMPFLLPEQVQGLCVLSHYAPCLSIHERQCFMDGTIRPYGDNFAVVIPVEDGILHPPDKPYCWDSTCGCHGDEALLRETQQFVLDGVMTPDEAVIFVAGRTV